MAESTLPPLVGFAAYTLFCWWAVFRDGAERLEGWGAWLAFGWLEAMLSAEMLRLYIAGSWLLAMGALAWRLATGAA